MPVSTPCWTTADGETHTNYLGSLKHELALFLSKGVRGDRLNEMKKFVETLTVEQIDQFRDLLTSITAEQKNPTEFRIVSLEPLAPTTTASVPTTEVAPNATGDNVVNLNNTDPGTTPKLFVDDSVKDTTIEAAA